MDELQEEQELEEVILDEEDDVEYALEEIGDNLEFLRDTSDNLNLYLAFKAYHDDHNFEEAIENFEAAIKYEKKHSKTSKTDESGEEIPNTTLVKCLYWLAESHNKIEQRDKAIRQFSKLAKDFDNHYLGTAAQRRVENLKVEG